jgi:hypothetical protein
MRLLLILGSVLVASSLSGQPKVSEPMKYHGMCDASAAVAIDSSKFAVASDEDSKIRIYSSKGEKLPLQIIDLTPFLELNPAHPETDMEGAARIGERIYWIGSHGRNRDGKLRLDRQRFFATTIGNSGSNVVLKLAGRPYKTLLQDLNKDPRFKLFNLPLAAQRAPKALGGLNIEGLSATPENHLLIGFRNPIPGGKALLIPLLNPDEVIERKPARFGDAILLDLDGLGIRDMAYLDGQYLIIAGHPDGSGHSHLYFWRGGSARPERIEVRHFKEYNPEAIIVYPGKGFEKIQVLSDDGTRTMLGRPCKQLRDPDKRNFRSFWIEL